MAGEEEDIGIWFGRYWTKTELGLLILAIERGIDSIADLTQKEYDVLRNTIRYIEKTVY